MYNLLKEAFQVEGSREYNIASGIITFFILISIAVIPVHFLSVAEKFKPQLLFIDQIAVSLFTIEYLIRLWTAENKFQYVFGFWGLVDLFSILPFYLSQLGIVPYSVLTLLLRLLRVLKFGKLYQREQTAITETQNGEAYGLFTPVLDEQVLRVIQQHPIRFIYSLLIPLFSISLALLLVFFLEFSNIGTILGAILLVLGFFLYYRVWLDYVFDVMIISNRRVVIQDRDLFGIKSNDISFQSITNVIPNNRGVINYIFDMGSVTIETAAATTAKTFKYAPGPLKIVRLISEKRQKAQRAVEEMDVLGDH